MRVVTDLSVVSVRRRRAAAPVLALDFVAGTYFARGVAKTRAEVMSFSRSTAGYRIAANGALESIAINQPRFTYSEITGAALGLWIEPAATNLITASSTPNVTWYETAGGAVSPVTSSLRGLAARTFTRRDNSFCEASGGNDVAVTPGQSYTFSFWAASTNAARIKPAIKNAVTNAWIIGQSVTDTTTTLEATGRRYTFTFTAPAGCTLIRTNIDFSNLSAAGAVITIAAPQVEQGTAATSTILTSGSAQTRAADVAGVLGVTGQYKVILTYDDLTTTTLNNVAIAPGWWPSLTRPKLRSLVIQ